MSTLFERSARVSRGLLIEPRMPRCPCRATGGVVERLMAPVLKTGRAKALVGSNPTPSANFPAQKKSWHGRIQPAPQNHALRRFSNADISPRGPDDDTGGNTGG